MSSLAHGCGMNHECIFEFIMYATNFYYNVLVLNKSRNLTNIQSCESYMMFIYAMYHV